VLFYNAIISKKAFSKQVKSYNNAWSTNKTNKQNKTNEETKKMSSINISVL